MPVPNEATRCAILLQINERSRWQHVDIASVAHRTHGWHFTRAYNADIIIQPRHSLAEYTGADLEALCRQAAMSGLQRCKQQQSSLCFFFHSNCNRLQRCHVLRHTSHLSQDVQVAQADFDRALELSSQLAAN